MIRATHRVVTRAIGVRITALFTEMTIKIAVLTLEVRRHIAESSTVPIRTVGTICAFPITHSIVTVLTNGAIFISTALRGHTRVCLTGGAAPCQVAIIINSTFHTLAI